MALHPRTQPGRTSPLGSKVSPEWVNFSVFSNGSTQVELLLFERVDDAKPSVVIPLDSVNHRTYHYGHVFVPGLQAGQIYGYRAFGPCEPLRGLRFDAGRVLFDPYGRAMAVPDGYSRIRASVPGDNCATAMKSVVAEYKPDA
jgi:isoamylase